MFTTENGVYVYCCLCEDMSKNVQDPQNQTYKICLTKRD